MSKTLVTDLSIRVYDHDVLDNTLCIHIDITVFDAVMTAFDMCAGPSARRMENVFILIDNARSCLLKDHKKNEK